MERPSEAAADASAASCTYSQVVFTNIPHSYTPSTPITCCYNLNAAYQPNSRDWVGIFKVGWSTTKDYHTFVWAEPCQDAAGQESMTMQVVFKEYYLPKDEIEFYQFCYVDNSGQVRGASTPFCFKTPEEQSSDSSTEDDFLIITTQVEQSNRAKAELQKELDQTREEKESLKRALEKEREEAAVLKGQNEQKEKERSQMVRDLQQIKEENGKLKSTIQQQQQEMDNLKEEMSVQAKKQLEIQQQNEAEKRKLSESLSFDGAASLTESQEKYDRAVKKINQMKEERKELKEKLDIQSEEISRLNSKLREAERELVKTRDSIHIVEVDLQSSRKEKERLSAELQKLQSVTQNMDEVRRENQELSRRLETQQETRQDASAPDDDLKVRCQTLARQLQDTQVKLAAEREEAKTARRQVEHLETERVHIRKQLDNMCMLKEEEERKGSKYEMQLREALEAIAEKEETIDDMERKVRLERHEKDELIRENQRLGSDLEGLRRGYSDLHAAPPDDSTYEQPDDTSTAEDMSQAWQQEAADESDHLYEPIVTEEPEEEQSLVCRHCQERFPGITQHELEQHEQSHRVCPFCTMICDTMEQSVFEDHVYSHEV